MDPVMLLPNASHEAPLRFQCTAPKASRSGRTAEDREPFHGVKSPNGGLSIASDEPGMETAMGLSAGQGCIETGLDWHERRTLGFALRDAAMGWVLSRPEQRPFSWAVRQGSKVRMHCVGASERVRATVASTAALCTSAARCSVV